jgi:hypothetical protein
MTDAKKCFGLGGQAKQADITKPDTDQGSIQAHAARRGNRAIGV